MINFLFTSLEEMVTLLVTGSYSIGRERVEIIKENGETQVCKEAISYPRQGYWAAGATWNDGTVTICGGSMEVGLPEEAQLPQSNF